MTKFTVAFFSGLLTLSSHAYAVSTVCSNGDINEVGDAHYQIEINKEGIQFFPYEGSFEVGTAELNFESGTFTVVNKKVTQFVEGEESSVTVDAILTINGDGTQLNAAISTDKGPFASFTMNCVTN
jgi:hypothetical protein